MYFRKYRVLKHVTEQQKASQGLSENKNKTCVSFTKNPDSCKPSSCGPINSEIIVRGLNVSASYYTGGIIFLQYKTDVDVRNGRI